MSLDTSIGSLIALLRKEGAQSPANLMSRFRLSQPTLFRWVRAQSDELIALGAPRNRKIAALREVRSLGSTIPIFKVSTDGEILKMGQLVALHVSSFAFLREVAPLKPLIYPGLPFFLDDVRPQGFLGKSFAQRHTDLRLSARIADWNNDDILEAIAKRGEDLTGNILIGAESFERFQAQTLHFEEAANAADPGAQYLAFAKAAIDGHPPGSSAGGEHPKFGTTLEDEDGRKKKVLVKFSPMGDTFSARRWSDLLISEFLALEVLRDAGIASARGRIFQVAGRTFLETERFDRVGAMGRKGVLSLAALENEWIGRETNWAESAAKLEQKKIISSRDLKIIRQLECFGRLIANTDRHPGNLSFFWEPVNSQAELAPVYDMLPMLYAPINGEEAGKKFRLSTYNHTLVEAWKWALPIAIKYWQRVTEDDRVSREFRNIAQENIAVLVHENVIR